MMPISATIDSKSFPFDTTPTYASLDAYQMDQRALPTSPFNGAVKRDQMFDQLLLDPPSPTTSRFDGMWPTSNAQANASSSWTPSAGMPDAFDGVGNSLVNDASSDWSDFLMPLLATVATDFSSGSATKSEPSTCSSSTDFSMSSTADASTAPQHSSSGDSSMSSGLPVSTATCTAMPAAQNHQVTTQDASVQPKLEKQCQPPSHNVNQQNAFASSNQDNNCPQVHIIASWLDQDADRNTGHRQHNRHQKQQNLPQGQSCTNSGSSSRQVTRPNSPNHQRSRPQLRSRSSTGNGYTWPSVDPQVFLWAAFMMNGFQQAQAGTATASPMSDYSAMEYDDEPQAQHGYHATENCNVDDAMDGTGDFCKKEDRSQSADCGLLPRPPSNSPEPHPYPLDPMAAFARAAAESMAMSYSWPMPMPTNMMELQHNPARSNSTFGRASQRHHQPPPSHRQRSRTSASSISNTNAAHRKHKVDAVRQSAVRSRRQSFVEPRQCASQSPSSPSESTAATDAKLTKPRAQSAGRSHVTERLPPLHTLSYSTPPDTSSSVSALTSTTTTTVSTGASSVASSISGPSSASSGIGNASGSLSFTITDKIVLKPRPGSGDEELAYPCATNSLLEMQNNEGPIVDAQQQAEEAVEKVQNLFPSDLYAPRFTRRGTCGREGWCSLCPQGEWYSMKRSQYLYHMQFDHGISNLTRRLFHPPQTLRVWNDAVSKTDGLCHHCNKWIPICFGPQRKRDFKAWFKHARKCHRDDTGCPI